MASLRKLTDRGGLPAAPLCSSVQWLRVPSVASCKLTPLLSRNPVQVNCDDGALVGPPVFEPARGNGGVAMRFWARIRSCSSGRFVSVHALWLREEGLLTPRAFFSWTEACF